MSNSFQKEKIVLFGDFLDIFEDSTPMLKHCRRWQTAAQMMERAGDTVHVPIQYIMNSQDGMDQTGNFDGVTGLSAPISLTQWRSSTFAMDAKELRDPVQRKRLAKAAARKLANDVNTLILDTIYTYGSLTYAKNGSTAGYIDAGMINAIMDLRGVGEMGRRKLGFSPLERIKMVDDLAGRTLIDKAIAAYDKGYLGTVDGLDTFKMASYKRLTAAVPGTGMTVNGANQYWEPVATSGGLNVDARTQTLTLASGGGSPALKAGDRFTIEGVYAVNKNSKEATSELMTFVIVEAPAGGGAGDYTIAPSIVSNGGSTKAGAMWKNCSATPANGAALTFLNIDDADVSMFWDEDAVCWLPGSFVVPSGAGVQHKLVTTEAGLPVGMTSWFDGDSFKEKIRLDCYTGASVIAPEAAGVYLANQVP